MQIPIVQVDSFTDTPFLGNPAAVCLLPQPISEATLQNIALEMNLSETAFISPHEDGFDLRWFTPVYEVDLCGHATLASAHVIWEQGVVGTDQPIKFHSRSGLLTCTRDGDLIQLDFPEKKASKANPPEGLLEALQIDKANFVGRNQFDFLVEVDSAKLVRDLAPNLSQLEQLDMRGVIVTAKENSSDADFVSRFFAPGAGVPEDPVTGSAHCCLGPYWSERLGKTDMIGYQASKRGGYVHVKVRDDRVLLGGNAVTVMRGQLEIQG